MMDKLTTLSEGALTKLAELGAVLGFIVREGYLDDGRVDGRYFCCLCVSLAETGRRRV